MVKKWVLSLLLLVFLAPQFALPAQAQSQDWDIEDLLSLAAVDINDYWILVSDRLDVDYQRPNLRLFDTRRINTRCGRAERDSGPFYCSRDHTIYMPTNFMQATLDEIGDFAVVIVLAHEWGHAMQAHFGNLGGLSIRIELQADCFAGAYSRFAAFSSETVILEEGDLEEGATALFLFGDDAPWFDPQAHGSGDARMASYQRGLNRGFSSC